MLKEITKETALKAYDRVFNRGKQFVSEHFIKSYKVNKAYVTLVRNGKDVAVLIYGEDDDRQDEAICLDSETFEALKQIDVQMSEILYKEQGL